tara:strand:+ start:173 stop:616 length:444 start_codon:yes stop_codon:yes gene_type:complete
MATTVTAVELTSTITESISLNGQTYGNTVTKSSEVVGNVIQRVLALPTSQANILLFGANDEAGQVVGDSIVYLRITNLDDTNYVQLNFQTAAENYSVKLNALESYVIMNNQMDAVNTVTMGTLEDMTKCSGKSNGDLCDIEILCVSS